jgi:hypothetical protein
MLLKNLLQNDNNQDSVVYLDKWDRTESPEIDPYVYSQLILTTL